MKNSIDKNIMTNIAISDEMKQSLLENCREGKRSGDLKFRYSTPLAAMLMVAVFSVTTLTASAAILSYRQRLADMDQEEAAGYETEVAKDTFVSLDEGFSRDLTENEIERSLTLERKYYDEGVFPEKEMPHYKTFDERSGNEVAYIEEDNKVYLPGTDMTDEQLLEYIDHDAKKRYINIKQLEADGTEPGRGIALESTVVAEGSGESTAVDTAKSFIKATYGTDIDDTYVVLVSYFGEPEGDEEEDDVIPLYNLYIYQPGLGYGNIYTVRINAADFSVMYNDCYNYKGEVQPN